MLRFFAFVLLALISVSPTFSQPAPVEVARLGRGTPYQALWHPDGTRFFVVTMAYELWVYDAETYEPLETIPDVRLIRFIPGRDLVVVYNAENQTSIRNLDDLEKPLFTGLVQFINFSPQGQWILGYDDNRTLNVLNTDTFELTMTGIPGGDIYPIWRSDGQRFLVSRRDNVTIWDIPSASIVTSFTPLPTADADYGSYFIGWEWSPDGARIIRDNNGRVEIRDSETGMLQLDVPGFSQPLYSQLRDQVSTFARWTSDGARFLSCINSSDADSQPCNLYDALTGRLVHEYLDGNYAFSFSPDKSAIAWGSIGILDGATGEVSALFELGCCGNAAAFWKADSSEVAFTAYWQSSIIIKGRDGQTRFDLKGHLTREGVASVYWSHDLTRIMSRDSGGRLIFWDAADGKILRMIDDHVTRSVGLSGNSRYESLDGTGNILTVQDSIGNVYLWDLDANTLLNSTRGSGLGLYSSQWQPDGTLLATTDLSANRPCAVCYSQANSLQIFQLGQRLNIPRNLPSDSIDWSVAGRKLALASQDGTIAIWDAQWNSAVVGIVGGGGYLPTLNWNTDGSLIAVHDNAGSHGGASVTIRDPDTFEILTPHISYDSYSTNWAWNARTGHLQAAYRIYCRPSGAFPSEPARCGISITHLPVDETDNERWGNLRDIRPYINLGSYKSPGPMVWSPDGTQIFIKDIGRLSVWNVNESGAELAFETAITINNTPDWREDGRYLLVPMHDGFHVLDSQSGEIKVDVLVEFRGSGGWHGQNLRVCTERLASGACGLYEEWSPETGELVASGAELPFVSSPNGRYEVYERSGSIVIFNTQPE